MLALIEVFLSVISTQMPITLVFLWKTESTSRDAVSYGTTTYLEGAMAK